MAATEARVGPDLIKAAPRGYRTEVQLEAGVEFHMNTLIGVRDADGFAENALAASTYSAVYFLTEDVDTTADAADGDSQSGKALKGVIVKLNAAGLTQANQGDVATVVDNDTFEIAGAGHRIGIVHSVISATEALVHVDGDN